MVGVPLVASLGGHRLVVTLDLSVGKVRPILWAQTRRKLRNASALSVFSQENSGSWRPKWP